MKPGAQTPKNLEKTRRRDKRRQRRFQMRPELAEFFGFFRFFSIRARWMFPLLVFGLAMLSIGAWWSVQTAIQSDVRSRLESEGDRIEATIRNRFDTFAHSLIHMRSQFTVMGLPTNEHFHELVTSLDVPHRLAGLRGFGYAPLARGVAKVSFIEPLDMRNRVLVGWNLIGDPSLREAFNRSSKTGDPILSVTASDPSFAIVLAEPDGALFATFQANEFFEGIFDAPSMQRERVDFALETLDRKAFYKRFDSSNEKYPPSLQLSRRVSFLGHEATLRVTPLPHFYKGSDTYLPLLVGFGAAFISILILLVLKSSQNQLIFETHAREISVLAAQRSRSQSELLNRLNQFSRDISSELDLDAIIDKLATLAPRLLQADASFFYCACEEGSRASVKLRNFKGLDESVLTHKSISLQEAHALLPNRFMMLKTDPDSAHAFKALITSEDTFEDWLLVGIPSRETGRCGLMFLARDKAPNFDDLEIEVIESFVTQAAAGMENARLFHKVAEASRVKNAFLANMSHEIRTPLNAIIGFSEMILKDPLNPQRAILAQNVRRGSDRLTRVIDNILDLSKIDSGSLLVERRRTPLLPLLQEIRAVMELKALEKHILFTMESAGLLPSHIFTDETRLKQVLSIVVGNAVKFTNAGTVTLSLRSLSDDMLVFRIKDSGVGIDSEVRERLFQPFSQADDSKTRRFEGTGMGLALSRKLCEELGGALDLIESHPGTGSVFEARIGIGPLEDVTWSEGLSVRVDDQRSPANELRLNEVRLLLVEDSEDNQDIFRFFLEKAGAQLDIVANGLDAVTSAASKPYDMILMDIQIPEIDGKEATRRIRRDGFTNPIVALTAHALLEERISCIEAGCDGQITKPVSGDSLITEVLGYLRRKHGTVSQRHERNEDSLRGATQI